MTNDETTSADTTGADTTRVGLPRWVRWTAAVVAILGIGAMAYLTRDLVTGRLLSDTRADLDEEVAVEAVLETAAAETPVFEEGLAPFALTVGGDLLPYRVMLTSVLPGEQATIEVEPSEQGVTPPGVYRAAVGAGTLDEIAAGRWAWTAPDSAGVVPLRVEGPEGGVTVHAFVLVPYEQMDDGVLNGYRISPYPTEPYQGNPVYNQPEGFIEVTPEVRDVLVSPHFTLGQFVCKQATTGDPYPKYLLLEPELLRKLEGLLAEVNADGVPASSFHVMSGYRTPFYNRSIGNTTTYSAHLYGIAADIFVDQDADVYMDDLNGDGAVNVEDARLLYETVEGADHEAWYEGLEGGLGLYGPAPHRGPFIHVDVRGEPVRWGI
jgi:hypothetical protein